MADRRNITPPSLHTPERRRRAPGENYLAQTAENYSAVDRGIRGEALRSLEDENGRLKRMLADAMLDNAALKDLLGKKW